MAQPVTPSIRRPSDTIEHTRAWTGLWAVVIGDAGIAIAAAFGVVLVKGGTAGSASVVSVLTSAFTTIGTLTTAYFGIRAVANTAHSSITGQQPGAPSPTAPSPTAPSPGAPSPGAPPPTSP